MGVWTPGPAATAGSDQFTGDGTAESANGLEGDDTLHGAGGNDTLVGGLGADTLEGGDNNDELWGDGPAYTDEISADLLDGGNGNDALIGGLYDTFIGGSGSDVAQVRYGGAADISIDLTPRNTGLDLTLPFGGVVRADVEIVHIMLGGGDDTIIGSNADDTLAGGTGDDELTGGGGDDFLQGQTGADVLIGGAGADTLVGEYDDAADVMQGGGQNDTLTGDFSDTFDGGDGIDTATVVITTSGDINLTGLTVSSGVVSGALQNGGQLIGIENLFIAGEAFSGAIGVRGSEASEEVTTSIAGRDDTFWGNGGDDVFLAGGGNDRFLGGAGDDGMVAGAGNDVMNGGDGDDGFSGEAGNDTFDGGLGDDYGDGGDGEDVFKLGAGHDFAMGGNDSDTIYAGDGDDEIYGENGSDEIYGGRGDDFLVGGNDLDGDPGGVDTGDTIWGDDGDDVIGGFEGEDTLYGGNDNDFLDGGDDNDTLDGGAGHDILNGNLGNDTIAGGAGDDTIVVDSAGDVIIEFANRGFDTVFAYVSWSLGNHLEDLVLLEDAANGTGNGLGNEIFGNDTNNVLDGKGGADFLSGGLGDDTYIFDRTTDYAEEFADEGYDRIISSGSMTLGDHFERLDLVGSGNLNGKGNALNNTIVGNAGNNVINGGEGVDLLAGGAGRDAFLFDAAPGSANRDRITDFNPANDAIRLDDAVFTALSVGVLASNAFRTGGAAADADDRIIYNSASGALLYDADGNGAGAAIHFATLGAGLAVTANDFVVI